MRSCVTFSRLEFGTHSWGSDGLIATGNFFHELLLKLLLLLLVVMLLLPVSGAVDAASGAGSVTVRLVTFQGHGVHGDGLHAGGEITESAVVGRWLVISGISGGGGRRGLTRRRRLADKVMAGTHVLAVGGGGADVGGGVTVQDGSSVGADDRGGGSNAQDASGPAPMSRLGGRAPVSGHRGQGHSAVKVVEVVDFRSLLGQLVLGQAGGGGSGGSFPGALMLALSAVAQLGNDHQEDDQENGDDDGDDDRNGNVLVQDVPVGR